MAAIFILATPAQAADYYLRAAPIDKTLPDGVVVAMWGFALDDDGDFTTVEHEPTVPGPRLSVPAGDTTLTVHLHNALPMLNGAPTPVSLVIMGQQAVMNPVSVTDAQGRARVRSFTHETMPGETGIYTWSALTPGTYLYQSGTHPALQVQMGLYGAVIQDANAGEAYAGLAYQHEVTLLYSEIDPALHAAVASDNYGPGKAVTSTIDYMPRYFLVNGEPHSPATTPLPAGNVGETLLVRFLNAGLRTHVPVVQGLYMQLVAEDGKLFPYPHTRYSALLPAGKTMDALLMPEAEGSYAVYDRRLHLTSGTNAPGGLFAALSVSTLPGSPQALNDGYATDEDVPLTIAAPGVLANDTDPDGNALSAILVGDVRHGTLMLNADGSLTYTPTANFAGIDTFTYHANDGTLNSNTATVTINVEAVNDPPLAQDDVVTTGTGAPVIIAVLANDMDVEGVPLTVTSTTPPANGAVTLNADNTVTYTPTAGYLGPDTFTYTASDGVLAATANVNITVQANTPPTAMADAATLDEDTSAVIAVLANDSDAEGATLVVTAVSTPTANGGSVTINADNTVTYVPVANFAGADSFTYTVSDGESTAVGTVNLTVTPVNDAPIAQADVALTAEDTAAMIDVLANDSDIEGDSLAISSVSSPAHGAAVVMGAVIHYEPAAGYAGTDSFTYTVSDGAATATGSVTVTVTAVNDPPEAVADAVTGTEDTPLVIAVLANDVDPDGNALTVLEASTPTAQGGTVIINADGTVTYMPAPNFNGSDTFTYTVSDGALTAIGTVTVTVTPVNDAPLALADAYQVDTSGTFTVTAANGVLVNDQDPDGDVLSAVLLGDANNVTVTLAADGGFTLVAEDAFVGTGTFTYNAYDGVVASNTVAVSVYRELLVDKAVFKDKTGTKRDEWVITGKSAVPGSTITLFVGAEPGGTVIGTATVGGDGGWSFQQFATVWPDGSGAISVQSSTGAQLRNVPLTINR
jgi:VCBS repeat-containing protein